MKRLIPQNVATAFPQWELMTPMWLVYANAWPLEQEICNSWWAGMVRPRATAAR